MSPRHLPPYFKTIEACQTVAILLPVSYPWHSIAKEHIHHLSFITYKKWQEHAGHIDFPL